MWYSILRTSDSEGLTCNARNLKMKDKKASEKPKGKKGPKGKIGPRVNKLHIIFALKQFNWEIAQEDVAAKVLPVVDPKNPSDVSKKVHTTKYLFKQLEEIVSAVSPEDASLVNDLRDMYYPDARKSIAHTSSIDGYQTDYKVITMKSGHQFVRVPFIENWWKLDGKEADVSKSRRVIVQYSKNNIILMRKP